MKTHRIFLLATLSLLGLAVSGYLGFFHVALARGELLRGPMCGEIGSLFNCHAVAASRFSRLLGLPLAFWGIVGYVVTLWLAVMAWQAEEWREQAFTALACLSALFLAFDAWLFGIMALQIRTLCALCLMTDLINILLLVVSKKAAGRSWAAIFRQFPAAARAFLPGRQRPVAWAFWGVVLTGLAGAVSVEAAIGFLTRPSARLREQMRQQMLNAPQVSVNTETDPMKGDSNAPIQMVEFVDFLCPLCREAAQFNAIILAGHRGEVSLRLKQFPLDRTCNGTITHDPHPGACRLAAAAKCAQEQGRYWALHDRLFQQGPQYSFNQMELDAGAAGLDMGRFRQCMESGRGDQAVQRDIQEAARLGIRSTPTYVVNGIIINGTISPEAFERLKETLPRQRQSNQR